MASTTLSASARYVFPQSCILSSLTIISVYDLSVALLARLPREIHDQVYSQILNYETMKEVVVAHSNSWDLGKGPTDATDTWPEFLKLNALDTQVTNEIVQVFCERNRKFRTEEFRLQQYLSHPVFGTPIILGTSVISSLAVELDITHREELLFQLVFKPLKSQQLVSGLVLQLSLRGSDTLLPSDLPAMLGLEDDIIPETSQLIVSTMQQLRPIIGYVEGLGKQRRVKIEVQVNSLEYGDQAINVTKDMRKYSQEEWASVLFNIAG
jgi:hypothetical protein